MDTTDGWPDAASIPWIELIHVRYQYQVDSIIAGVIQRAVTPLLSAHHARAFSAQVVTAAAKSAVTTSGKAVEFPGSGIRELTTALEDFDELCPESPLAALLAWLRTHPGHGGPPPPGPGPDPWADSMARIWLDTGSAEAPAGLVAASRLLDAAGSGELRDQLGPVLRQATAALAEGRESFATA